jgi:hypothetical protein
MAEKNNDANEKCIPSKNGNGRLAKCAALMASLGAVTALIGNYHMSVGLARFDANHIDARIAGALLKELKNLLSVLIPCLSLCIIFLSILLWIHSAKSRE